MKNVFVKTFALLFVLAGINHFISPEFYLPLIPDYLPFPSLLNVVSGVLEVLIGTLLWTYRYRRIGGLAFAALMVLFIPAHVHFIQMGYCLSDGQCVPAWVGWGRLLVIQPLLIALGLWMAEGSRRKD
jgi:uncharacterized membrane protein